MAPQSASKWSKIPTFSPEEAASEYGADLEGLLRLDPKVIKGILPNGATYYVRPNAEPKERAELRVALKVGSVLEADHERGIAHLIEHLAFRGSKEQEGVFEMIRELESYGVQFGAHQNAVTGFESTMYELHVPTDDWELMTKAFFILRDLSLEARLSDADLDAERQIVVEEWRQSRSGGMRASEHYGRLLLEGSKYADRFPIGLMEVIETVTGDTLRDFYSRFYCPSNCCIVAVGDFEDPHAIVDLIKQTFTSAVNNPNVVPLPPLPSIPSHPECKVAVFTDPEVSSASVSVECKRLGRSVESTAAEFRESLTRECFHMALSNRLEKLAYAPDPPFTRAGSSGVSSMPLHGLDGSVLSITCAEDGVLTALHSVLMEVERVRAEGFSAKELENVRSNIRSDLLADFTEKDQIDSKDFCEELTDLFLFGQPMMALEEEVRLSHYLLSHITDKEISDMASEYHWGADCVVHATLPTPKLGHRLRRLLRHGKDTEPVTEDAIRRVMVRARAGLHKDGEAGHQLHPEEVDLPPVDLPPGWVVSKTHHARSDVTELVLSNGLVCAYKCTHWQDDEVQLSATAYGGLSEFHGDKQRSAGLASARWGDTLASEFGIGGLSPATYNELFAGMRLHLSPRTDKYSRSVRGNCSPQDLETMLHVVHLLFTVPIEVNKDRLKTIIKRTKDRLSNSSKNPHEAFSSLVNKINTNDHPFFRPFTRRDLRGLDAQAALAYFRKCFSDPSHFKLILVGNLSPDDLLPLVNKYLGSIPRPPSASPPLTRHTIQPLCVTFPSKPIRKTLRLLVEQTCLLKVTLPITVGDPVHGTHLMRLRDTFGLLLCADIVERRLLEVLRFELGSIYTINVYLSFVISNPTRLPTDLAKGELFIGTGCPPDKVEFLTDRIFSEVEKLRTEGPKQEEVVTAVEAARRASESQQRTNGWWLNRVLDAWNGVRYNGDLDAILQEDMATEKEVREGLTPEAVRDLLSRTIETERHTVAVLKPQPRAWLWIKTHSLHLLGVGGVAAVLVTLYVVKGRQAGRTELPRSTR